MPKEKDDKLVPVGKTPEEIQAEELEQLEGKNPEALKKSRAMKMDDDEYTWAELKNSSNEIFEVPPYVLDGAAFFVGLDTTKPIKKSVVKAAITKFQNKEVETI